MTAALRPDWITDDALPARHGFFTRRGGASSGVFAGLNCGAGSSDQREIVAHNRAAAARAMGVEPGALASVQQVHSADVAVIGRPLGASRPRADAMVTRDPDVALGILTADCGPVLLADPEAGVAGAAHAGWGGALAGVLEATVGAMAALGASPARIRAVLGPTIGPDAYEVGPEFRARFRAHDEGSTPHFRPGTDDRFLFDLPAYIVARLAAAGVAARWTGHCTYADPERFYSYRRSVHRQEADYGRLISVIRAPQV